MSDRADQAAHTPHASRRASEMLTARTALHDKPCWLRSRRQHCCKCASKTHTRSCVTGVIVTRTPDPTRCILEVHAVERAAQIIREDLGHSVRQAADFSGPIILLAVRTLQLPACYRHDQWQAWAQIAQGSLTGTTVLPRDPCVRCSELLVWRRITSFWDPTHTGMTPKSCFAFKLRQSLASLRGHGSVNNCRAGCRVIGSLTRSMEDRGAVISSNEGCSTESTAPQHVLQVCLHAHLQAFVSMN